MTNTERREWDPPEKVEGDGLAEIEAESTNDLQLHLPDLGLGVGVVGDVDKVGTCWGVDLLDLGGEEHGGHTDQLQLRPGDRQTLDGEEAVHNGDRAEQGLLHYNATFYKVSCIKAFLYNW